MYVIGWIFIDLFCEFMSGSLKIRNMYWIDEFEKLSECCFFVDYVLLLKLFVEIIIIIYRFS